MRVNVKQSKTYVDLIVQRSCIYARPVRTPRDGRDRAPELIHAHGLLRALVAPLPHANRAVVTAGGDELDASASCESSVEGINDTTVSVESTHTLACREDCDIQGAVSGDGVQDLGR